MLAVSTDTPIQPPDCGMIEEQGFDAHLKYVHECVQPLDVRQLVCDHQLELLLGETGQRASRQKNNRTKPPEDRGRL